MAVAVNLLPHQLKFLQSQKRYVALCGAVRRLWLR